VVADPATRAAALIDPVLEQAERDLEVVDGLGLTLQILLNTHCHADHITGTGKLKSLRPGARSAIAAAAGAAADIKLSDNQVVQVGGLELKCLSTPGHTDGCMSFYLPAAGMVFTGDTLLVRGCGRTDFQQGDAGRLYDSVHARLFTLPEDALVYPAHDYKGRAGSSIGEEKALNARLTKPKAEFVGIMASLNLPYPKQIDRAVPANLKCGVDFPSA
jgi:sulfur dioxygenase